MKKQILLLVFLGISCSVIAMQEKNPDAEAQPLLATKRYEVVLPETEEIRDKGRGCSEEVCSAWCGACTAIMTYICAIGIVGGVVYGLSKLGTTPSQCPTTTWDRTNADCVSNNSSFTWAVIECQRILYDKENLVKTCLPVCNANGLYADLPTGWDEWKNASDVAPWITSAPDDKYRYVICEKGSWLGRLKAFLSTKNATTASVNTQDGEGLLLSKKYLNNAIDKRAYKKIAKKDPLGGWEDTCDDFYEKAGEADNCDGFNFS